MQAVVFSSDSVDGICAAACIMRGLRLKNLPCKFGGMLSTEKRDAQLQHIIDQNNVALFLADYPPDAIPDVSAFLRQLAGKVSIAYWSFCQVQKPETLSLLSGSVKHIDYASTNNVSSTELAAFRFLPGDMVGKQLTAFAADIKFWLRQDERATKLADLLMSGFDPKEIVDALSRGVMWDDTFERARTEYLEKKTKAFEDLMKRLTIKDYLKYRLGFALSPTLLSTADACQYILDKHTGVDVSVAIYKSGKIAFRRRDSCDMDVKKLAHQFNGGGQTFAAGGSVGMDVSAEHWDEVLFQVDRKLKDYFLA